ncbi:MAG: sulfotransferase [Anaerolineae bacterium]
MAGLTDQRSLQRQWQRLDPIFIMGRQRTGTSIMWRTLRVASFLGFNEGHLWFDLVVPFASFRDPHYKKLFRQDIFALGAERNLVLEKRFALMVDKFHRDLLPPELVRWVDKSPGVNAVRVAPMLSELFPRAQFIFMKRSAITTVDSTINYISRERDLDAFRRTCQSWAYVMRTWRTVRHLLAGRYIEVEQEQVARRPHDVGQKVASFLGVPEYAGAFGSVFESRRENSAFPDREPGDYIYPVPWNDEQRATLVDLCQEEMRAWGYPLDFRNPAGIDPAQTGRQVQRAALDRASYYRWVARAAEGERASRCEEELARIREGRVMRVLSWMENLLRSLGLR